MVWVLKATEGGRRSHGCGAATSASLTHLMTTPGREDVILSVLAVDASLPTGGKSVLDAGESKSAGSTSQVQARAGAATASFPGSRSLAYAESPGMKPPFSVEG